MSYILTTTEMPELDIKVIYERIEIWKSHENRQNLKHLILYNINKNEAKIGVKFRDSINSSW